MEETLTELGRAVGPLGEVLLRRRTTEDGPVEELVVNGVFAMDSTETRTERELARLAPTGPGARVLVGGLGLGYTATTVLERVAPDARVDVVELEGSLVAWARAGLTPVLARVAGDPRTRLHVADVSAVLHGTLAAATGPWDAVLLDVDNGPDFLIHEHNRSLYDESTLRAAQERLTADGVLAVWCQGPAPALAARLQRLGPSREHEYTVRRGNRELSYVIHTLRRAPGPLGENGRHG